MRMYSTIIITCENVHNMVTYANSNSPTELQGVQLLLVPSKEKKLFLELPKHSLRLMPIILCEEAQPLSPIAR